MNSWILTRSWCLALLLTTVMVAGSFIDMDTPVDKRTTRSLVDDSVYELVMSDEFNVPNRTFKDGHDPLWTALDKSDDDSTEAGGGSLHFYNSSWVTTTENGRLKIAATAGKTEWTRFDHVKREWKNEQTHFKSGMLQSWNKFCFTGGIVEVDIIMPGDPFIGGLWPAVWMLGNLGRATYEASTNNIWPWSYDTCNRTLQDAQDISACNVQNHYGLNPHQGRGATEIDIVEVMTGTSDGPLPGTDPPVSIPYADFTLQVAPGIPDNRPQSGAAPQRKSTVTNNGRTTVVGQQTWYDDLIMHGNTSINPFFYGTYLGETKPSEPVTRTKKQAFQADAIGAVHQLTPAHFEKMHTFRLEWQPGRNGRIDWFVKSYKKKTENGTISMEGDGEGHEWTRAYTLLDKSLKDAMGSQIPNEPSYLIMNLAISSTWGFPYDTPTWCTKCFDCDDPKCACAFHPGFCQQLKKGVAMYVDSVRVYQSNDPSAHVGNNHTLGCDPPEYPTQEWIEGHTYRYMRNPPFSYLDKDPMRRVQKGGGPCHSDADCGGSINKENFTESHEQIGSPEEERALKGKKPLGRGACVDRQDFGGMFASKAKSMVCKCHDGYTGPYCMAQDYFGDFPSAKVLRAKKSPFSAISKLELTPFMVVILVSMVLLMVGALLVSVTQRKRSRAKAAAAAAGGDLASSWSSPQLERPKFTVSGNPHLIITGTSV